MNKTELQVEMLRHDDTSQSLAAKIGISNVSFSNKMNGKLDFTRHEMNDIRKQYELSDTRFMEIFFASEVH